MRLNNYNLDTIRKNALITGASSGIGKATAEMFAENQYNLVLQVRSETDELHNWIDEIRSKHEISITILICDFQSEDEFVNFLKRISELDFITTLINCAGMPFGATIMMTSVSKLRSVFEINFFNQIRLIQIVLKKMIRQKYGTIINVTSMSGVNASRGNLAYGASKSSLNYATKVLATEMAEYGIRVNAICPGAVATKMLDEMEPSRKKELIEKSALKRAALPHEIASIALFLASDASSYLNGAIIEVDGGRN